MAGSGVIVQGFNYLFSYQQTLVEAQGDSME
jgi:hypothetical protein